MHPEATDDPQTLRWVIPPGTLPVLGEIADAPGVLGELLASGSLGALEVGTAAVSIRLEHGRTWTGDGVAVRDALATALRSPEQWRPVHEADPDDLLRSAVEDVIDGATGDYIRSHGGEVQVVSVVQGRVQVRMSGACAHCPALGFTLHSRLECEVRRRCPDLVELRAVPASGRPRSHS
jgi:Fe-S cluster biogenesis protein NfuA